MVVVKFNTNGKDYFITLIATPEPFNNAEQWIKESWKQQNNFILWMQKSENVTDPGLSATTHRQIHSQACLTDLIQSVLQYEVNSALFLSISVSSKMKLTQEKLANTSVLGQEIWVVTLATTLVSFQVLCLTETSILHSNTEQGNWMIYKWLLILLWFKPRNPFLPWCSGLNPRPCACWAYGLQISYPCNKESFCCYCVVLFWDKKSQNSLSRPWTRFFCLTLPSIGCTSVCYLPHLAGNSVKQFYHLPHRLILFNKSSLFNKSFLWVPHDHSLSPCTWWRTWAPSLSGVCCNLDYAGGCLWQSPRCPTCSLANRHLIRETGVFKSLLFISMTYKNARYWATGISSQVTGATSPLFIFLGHSPFLGEITVRWPQALPILRALFNRRPALGCDVLKI